MSQKSVSVHAQIDHNLLAFIAHETRGPFNGLIGFSELLHTNLPSLSAEQLENYSELVHQLAIKSFLQLQTLIVWVKLISDNLTIHNGIFSLEEWIEQVITSLEVDFKAKNIQFETAYLSREINGDQQLLSIALANLLYAMLRNSNENSSICIESDENIKSISISIDNNEIFETLLNDTLTEPNPENQNEQNFRIWIAYQVFKMNGIKITSAPSPDKNLLITTLHLPR